MFVVCTQKRDLFSLREYHKTLFIQERFGGAGFDPIYSTQYLIIRAIFLLERNMHFSVCA